VIYAEQYRAGWSTRRQGFGASGGRTVIFNEELRFFFSVSLLTINNPNQPTMEHYLFAT